MLKHPFYQAWIAGTLSLERLQNYAVEYLWEHRRPRIKFLSQCMKRPTYGTRAPAPT